MARLEELEEQAPTEMAERIAKSMILGVMVLFDVVFFMGLV